MAEILVTTKPENVRKWVAALRSGEHAQTKGVLRNNEGFCCLGVACELAVADGAPVSVKVSEWGTYYYDTSKSALPRPVQDWLGIYSASPAGLEEGQDTPVLLSNLNDDGGYSFSEIAEVIEHTYLTSNSGDTDNA